MILGSGDFRVTSTEIRGVQYVVFSFFQGKDLVFDHIGKLIENSFDTTNVNEFSDGFLVDNSIDKTDEI